VYGQWPGLGQDLTVTTDFPRALGEAAYKTLEAKNLDGVSGSQAAPGEFWTSFSGAYQRHIRSSAIPGNEKNARPQSGLAQYNNS
jgi:hypothetical protein